MQSPSGETGSAPVAIDRHAHSEHNFREPRVDFPRLLLLDGDAIGAKVNSISSRSARYDFIKFPDEIKNKLFLAPARARSLLVCTGAPAAAAAEALLH